MLAVSPLRNNNERENQMEGNDFSDFAGCNFLDSIDFDDLFINISDEHELPDLEMDPEILAEFSVTTSSAEEDNSGGFNGASVLSLDEDTHNSANTNVSSTTTVADKKGGELGSGPPSRGEQEIASKSERVKDEKGRKSTAQSSAKNPTGKKKVKVDWTPELHRRFVQAVEQLGVDKAVPSRILELMGIDCLTRHNIASHLQKYRSHRKHLLAREAAAANWSQRRQMYGGGGGKREAWITPPPPPPPTMGFPPPPPVAPMTSSTHHFRPLHVWGHPPMDHHHLHMWPKHPPPPHGWPSPPPPQSAHHRTPPPALIDPSFWMSQHQPQRFPSPPVVPGIPPPPPATMYRPETTGQPLPQVHPSKESVDEAIGHVLSQPWMPLPLGLKPPSVESVMSELQRQGISKIPPAANCV